MEKENKVAVIGIVVSNREETSKKVNEVLSSFGSIIVGRKKDFGNIYNCRRH